MPPVLHSDEAAYRGIRRAQSPIIEPHTNRRIILRCTKAGVINDDLRIRNRRRGLNDGDFLHVAVQGIFDRLPTKREPRTCDHLLQPKALAKLYEVVARSVPTLFDFATLNWPTSIL